MSHLKVSEYFDGNVKSIAFLGETLPATVGVMAAGEYTFSTDKFETMTVVSGVMTVKLPGETDFRDYRAGDQFTVDANQSFDLEIAGDAAYLCTYA